MIEGVAFDHDSPALHAGADSISYRELGRRVEQVRNVLAQLPRPALVFLFGGNSPTWIATYLACLAERLPLGLGEPQGPARDRVIAAYTPGAIIMEGAGAAQGYVRRAELGDGLTLWVREAEIVFPFRLNPDIAALLATSGSTGDAKFVRLTRANLLANARSISAYLGLNESERAVQSLPLHYSYGLSVLNSHLIAGASVTLTPHSFMRPEFWRVVEETGCTSFAGVPYMYETLQRLRISPAGRGAVRTLTQAGGHLRPELVQHFHEHARAKGARFFVMYGQTEATARIAYVPPDRLSEKLGSIGIAIPGGVLSLEPVDGDPDHQQLIYCGPNVMLGYATGPADLARGDEMAGRLATGDLAAADNDGFFRITGRLTRFAKLFGKRVSLGAVESETERTFESRAIAIDASDRLRIFIESSDATLPARVRGHVSGWLGVPPPAVEVQLIAELPMTTNGKKNYKALQ